MYRVHMLLVWTMLAVLAAPISAAAYDTVSWSGNDGVQLCGDGVQWLCAIRLASPQVSIQYHTQAVNLDTGAAITQGSGATVRPGERIQFTFVPHQYTDVSWFGTGWSFDSPYGEWAAGAAGGVSCNSKDYVGTTVWYGYIPVAQYVRLVVNPPTRSFTNSSNLSCSGDGTTYTCTVTGSGTAVANLTFAATYGLYYSAFYNPYWNGACNGVASPMQQFYGGFQDNWDMYTWWVAPSRSGYTMNVPAKTVSYSIGVAAPSCSLSLDWDNTPAYRGSVLRWTTQNATSFSISPTIGTLSGGEIASGSRTVTPVTTTTYTGTASGNGASATCSKTLTVLPVPTGTISVDSPQILEGETTMLRWNTTDAFSVNIPQLGGWVSASGNVEVASGGTYDLYVYAGADDPDPVHKTATLTVLRSCTQDGITLQSGQSATFYMQSTVPVGTTCSAVSQARTCTDGTLSGTSTYQYGACSCTASSAYSCSGNTIVRTNTSANCSTSVTNPYATCVSPQFCTSGSAVCIDPTPTFVASSGRTGHLEIRPQVVVKGASVALYWNVGNVVSCSVTGNGGSWTGTASPAGGVFPDPIYQRTDFRLTCQKLDGSTMTETQTVNILPGFSEQ